MELINQSLSGPFMVILIILVGIAFTIKFKFVQFRCLIASFKEFVNSLSASDTTNGITPFQAMATALSGTIGTGNIVGVGTAIFLGGTGSLFWLCLSSVFSMATKYAEIYYSQLTKKDNQSGTFIYLEKASGNRMLSVCFSIFCILSSFGIGNMVQSNAVITSLKSSFDISSMHIILILMSIAIIVFIIIIGGVGRITKVCQFVIPFMAVFYIMGCCYIIFSNLDKLLPAVFTILSDAFNLESATGGVVGFLLNRSIRYGFTRGIFTNEAGLGSAPIAHGCAEAKSPHNQGLLGIFEVFFDTVIMCGLTGIVIVICGDFSAIDGGALTLSAFENGIGSFASGFVALSTIFFAVASIVGWFFYGTQSLNYLFSCYRSLPYKSATLVYKYLFVSAVIVGGLCPIEVVWDLSDLLNSLMMIPNLIGLTMLCFSEQ